MITDNLFSTLDLEVIRNRIVLCRLRGYYSFMITKCNSAKRSTFIGHNQGERAFNEKEDHIIKQLTVGPRVRVGSSQSRNTVPLYFGSHLICHDVRGGT